MTGGDVVPASSVLGAGGHVWADLMTAEERMIAPFYKGRRQFRASSTALLMIDLYNRAFGRERAPLSEALQDEPSSCGLAGWDSLPQTQKILRTARDASLPVIYTTAAGGLSGLPKDAVTAVQRNRAGREERDPEWGDRIVSALTPAESDTVLFKARASAFAGTPLDSWLRVLGVESLIVCGESTSGCVRATVVDAYSLGFDVIVAEQAVFDRSQISHCINLFDMNLKYATVAHTETVVDVIRRRQDLLLEVTA